MKVAGHNRASAIELVHRMEGSTHFQGAQLVQEGSTENGTGVAAVIVAVYVPDASNRSGK
jgi:hypothetical protein